MRHCRIFGRSAGSWPGWSGFALLQPNIGEAPSTPAGGHPVAHGSGDANIFGEKDKREYAALLQQAALFGEALLGIDEGLRAFGGGLEMKLLEEGVKFHARRKGIVVPGEEMHTHGRVGGRDGGCAAG
jgi:hypothetical protein